MIDVKNASNNGMNCLNGSYPLTFGMNCLNGSYPLTLLTNMDYIFYRLYRMYEKHGDPPCLSAVIHLCYSLGISLIIAFFAIKEWYDMQHKYAWFLEGLYSLCFLLVPLCLLIIYCCIRYRKKKILELKKKYQGCTRNKLISNWMIFCIPIYIAIIGILIFRKLFIA